MSPDMTVEQVGDAQLVRLKGLLDLENAETTRADIRRRLPSGSGRVALDIGGLDYCDSAGVRALFQLHQDFSEAGHDLRMVVPVASPVRRLIEFVDLPARIPVYENATEALTSP